MSEAEKVEYLSSKTCVTCVPELSLQPILARKLVLGGGGGGGDQLCTMGVADVSEPATGKQLTSAVCNFWGVVANIAFQILTV